MLGHKSGLLYIFSEKTLPLLLLPLCGSIITNKIDDR